MPERFPAKNPMQLVGSPVESGVPNTGQLQMTQGGDRVHTIFSGTAGGDANIWVGGGRIDAGFFHDSAIAIHSGQAVTFYDSAVAVSGGPLAASGHKVVAVLAPPTNVRADLSGGKFYGGEMRNFGFTFSSGLCFTGRSGQPGWSISYTPVVSN